MKLRLYREPIRLYIKLAQRRESSFLMRGTSHACAHVADKSVTEQRGRGAATLKKNHSERLAEC